MAEIASLRKQNEEQQRELEQLRAVVSPSLRQCHSNSVQPSTMPRFMLFPFEIREKIWEYALPRRLLGTEDIHQKHVVLTNLSVPTLAHVCRESRGFAMSKNHVNGLPGEFDLLGDRIPSPRLKDPTPACRTWFSPSHDTLMIRLQGCGFDWSQHKRSLARVAEHIIVEDPTLWRGFQEYSNGLFQNAFYEQCATRMVSAFTDWVHLVYVQSYSDNANCAGRLRGSICNLRTADFAMRKVTKVDPSRPPRLLRRLFASNDVTRVVDLRGTEPAEVLRMLGYELSQGMDPDDFLNWTGELADSLSIYQSVVEKPFQRLVPAMLKAVASACFEVSNMESSGARGLLANPFLPGGSELDMRVGWVKELTERLAVRPVHVFVLGEDKPENQFTHRSPKRLFPTKACTFE